MTFEERKKQFDNNVEITWCPGCGDFAILDALKIALAELELSPHQVMIASGIGQAAKLPHYINANGFNGLHGRGLPPALGIHTANKDLALFITSGEGDTYGEGGNHFIHNMRRNINLVHMVHDNQIYGLTKGQGSPTTMLGQKTSMQLDGVYVEPLNPMALAIASGASFVARSFSGRKDHLVAIIKEAYAHQGYALIDILQPCVSFNKVNTFKWYNDRVQELPADYDSYDKVKAFETAQLFGDIIPIGVLYRENRPTYVDSIPQLKNQPPLIHRQWQPENAEKFLKDFI